MNILVLCTGNSARSILLEAILNRSGRIRAFSAGSHPAGRVHPGALELLKARGFDTASLRSKSWDEFAAPGAPEMDVVLTVCDAAAGETCPLFRGQPLRAHWGLADPALLPPADQPAAFEQTFARLAARAEALMALAVETLPRDELQAALTRIGAAT